MEVAQDLDGREVCTRLIDDLLGTILDKVFEELQRLVNLAPVLGLLLYEAAEDGRHNLVEIMADVSRHYTLVVGAV